VALSYNSTGLKIRIRNDGDGFDLKPMEGERRAPISAFTRMWELAFEMKGKLEITARIDGGKEVLLRVPSNVVYGSLVRYVWPSG
jgi:hypothetical protein